MPFVAENYSVLENQLLECYWALAETKHLTMNHQLTMSPQLLVMH